MQAALQYAAPSALQADADGSALLLSPNLLRERTHLVARVAQPLEFRDAMLALWDVARSELYVTPGEIERRALDPVVTVAGGGVYFEAFSQDESTYGRVSLREPALTDVEQVSAGTTNVEFSQRLVHGLERVRSGSRLSLRVGSQGIALEAEGRRVEEQKIELPDSWVHGFLAVAGALARPADTLTLHPGDLRNVLTYLRGRKAAASPRSLRFRLAPGVAPSVLVEPWNEVIELERSTSDVQAAREVRVWGRRRLLLLQKALPGASGVRARLQGSGLPSFWTVERGAISLTLGLSPWTERDWAGLEPVPLGDEAHGAALAERAALHLAQERRSSAARVAAALGSDEGAARAALDRLCVEGRALYEPAGELYLARRLFAGVPPPPPPSAERARAAQAIVGRQGVEISARAPCEGGLRVDARVKGNGTYPVTAVLDPEGRLLRGSCGCPFSARMGLERGACKHLLALALAAR